MVTEQPAWHASVREMPHVKGFSYPVFEWSYGMNGLRGGEIRVWSLQAKFSYVNRREGDEVVTDPEGVLLFAESMGWGAPPRFAEVFEALAAVPAPRDLKDAAAGFANLKAKWEKLV